MYSLKEQVNENEVVTIAPKVESQIVTKITEHQENLNVCNQERDEALSTESIYIYPLDKQYYLVEILCFVGAYQGNFQYMVGQHNSDELVTINFVTFSFQDDELKLTNTATLVGTPTFDREQRLLTVFTKYRGLGDCGSFATYQWQNSSNFELQQYRDKSSCDGDYLDPENYPQIYP